LAGKVKQEFGDQVTVETVPVHGARGGWNGPAAELPNLVVDGKPLGKHVTMSRLKQEVAARLDNH